MFDPEIASDRAEIGRLHDADLEPPAETEQYWSVRVTITREFEGVFFGTKEEAERQAKNYFKRCNHEFEEENVTTKIKEE